MYPERVILSIIFHNKFFIADFQILKSQKMILLTLKKINIVRNFFTDNIDFFILTVYNIVKKGDYYVNKV